MRKPSQPVSLAMIAAEAGVSVSTVSRIVNGQLHRANRETVERVQALVEKTGYRPNSVGRALRRGESRIVAMLAPNLDNPAMGAIASSTESALRAAGYVMILCDTHDQPDLQDDYLEAMRAQSVQGYILVSSVASAGLARFLARGEPAVLVGRRQNHAGRQIPFVGIDNRQAGADAADFLLDAGIARPALLHAALTSSAIEDRVEGFLARLEARGLARDDIPSATADGHRHLEIGYHAMLALTAEHGWPRGLLCVSDQMAYGATAFAREQGIGVPQECLIVGVDDNPINPWLAPWLSSVHIPYEEYGPAIVAQLQALWGGEKPADRLLPHRLIDRRHFA